jgi:hypothetical protein
MSISRLRFIVATGLGTGVLASFDQLIARAASADANDLATLNAAIELERAGIKAYDDAAGLKLLSPKPLEVAHLFRRDHVSHLAALQAAVTSGGGTPSTKIAKVDYPQMKSEKDVLGFASTVEKLAASTYLSVIPEFKDRNLAQVAGAILGVETTHVGMLASALGEFPPYPSGFVK